MVFLQIYAVIYCIEPDLFVDFKVLIINQNHSFEFSAGQNWPKPTCWKFFYIYHLNNSTVQRFHLNSYQENDIKFTPQWVNMKKSVPLFSMIVNCLKVSNQRCSKWIDTSDLFKLMKSDWLGNDALEPNWTVLSTKMNAPMCFEWTVQMWNDGN